MASLTIDPAPPAAHRPPLRRARGLRGAVGLLLIALVVTACGDSGPRLLPAPTQEEALAYIDEVVELARTRDFQGLCAVGSPRCRAILADATQEAAPDEGPTIVSSRPREGRIQPDGEIDPTGILFRICGIDGIGRPYSGEMLVHRTEEGRLKSIEPVFWAGYRMDSGMTSVGKPAQMWEGCPV